MMWMVLSFIGGIAFCLSVQVVIAIQSTSGLAPPTIPEPTTEWKRK
jgi:hypothetical protein